MKRIFLSLIVALLFSGSMFGQTLHWSHFENTENSTSIIGFVYLDGDKLNSADYEIGAFVGDECRGNKLLRAFNQMPNVYWAWFNIFYETAGETVQFKLYQHSTSTEYDICTTTLVLGEEVVGEIDNPFPINFYSPITKEIIGYTGNDRYYLIASPIGQVEPNNVTNMISNTYDLYAFDQSASDGLEWINFKNPENNFTTLEPGKGYLYANSQTINLIFKDAPYTGSPEVTLIKDDNVSMSGWNLVGNPFNQTVYVDKLFYTMNDGGTEITAATVGDGIAPMEGIFVTADTDGEILTFTTEAPAKRGEQLIVNVSQNRSGAIDRAIIHFGEGGILPKFMLDENNTQLYIPQDGENYAVVRSAEQGEIPVNFKARLNGTYTLSFNTENVDMLYLHLVDNLTGADVDLLETPSYNFNAKNTDYASRFKLVFATGNSDETFAFNSNGNWIINNEGNATLQVVDITGRVLSSEQISGCYSFNFEAAAGVYMFRLINGNDMKVQKILVK